MTTMLLSSCEDDKNKKPLLNVDETPMVVTKIADEYQIEIESNGHWTAQTDYTGQTVTGWITYPNGSSGDNNGTLTVKVAANQVVAQREAVIVITMGDLEKRVPICQSGIVPDFSILPTELNDVVAEGDSYTITVTANMDWEATEDSDFISLADNTGSMNGEFTIIVDANPTLQQRTAKVIVTPESGESQEINITQDALVVEFSVTPTELTATSALADYTFTVTSNVSWSVSETSDFFNITTGAEGGSGNGQFVITVHQNTTIQERSSTITVTPTGGTPQTITVTQMAVPVSMYFDGVTAGQVNFTAASGSYIVMVRSNVDWQISCPESFVSFSTSSGTGAAGLTNVTISVPANDQPSQRTAAVTLSAVGVPGVTPETITVIQAAANMLATGITINGITWAASNLVAKGVFGNKLDTGCLFQFNSDIAWVNGQKTVSDATGWRTVGDPANVGWATENDPCPVGWRVPTASDFNTLPTSSSLRRRVYTNNDQFRGTDGWWFGSDATAVAQATFDDPKGCLFLPKTYGCRGDDLQSVESISGQQNRDGYYWSSTPNSSNTTASCYTWTTGNPSVANRAKTYACAVRCVKI